VIALGWPAHNGFSSLSASSALLDCNPFPTMGEIVRPRIRRNTEQVDAHANSRRFHSKKIAALLVSPEFASETKNLARRARSLGAFSG